jgi:hypothetical protein
MILKEVFVLIRSDWRTDRHRPGVTISSFRGARLCVASLASAMLGLAAVPAHAQEPLPPPPAVDTQRLDSLRRMFRTPAESTRRSFSSDTARLAAATPSSRQGVRAVTPVRPVSRGDSVRQRAIGTDGVYDVVLDVPNVSVEEIVLQVDGVRAHVSLDARVAKLVQLSVGADVGIERVHLGIRGVQAEAHLRVDLDNVALIVDRVLTTIDRNPQIIAGLLETLETTVATVGSVANTALQPGGVVSEAVRTVGGVATTALQPGGVVSEALQTVGRVANTALQPGGVVSGLVGAVGNTLQNVTGQGGLLSAQGIDALGQTVLRTVDATGRIVERTVDQAGGIVGENVVGSVLQLPIVGQGRGPGGQLVRTVQDVSGALIGVTTDAAGKILSTDVLRGATRAVGEAAGDVELPAVGGRAGRRGAAGAGGLPAMSDVTGAVGNIVGAVPGAATGLLQHLVLTSSLTREGRTAQRVVELTGSIIERVVDPTTGKVVSRKEIGNALTLPLVREQMDPSGSLLRVVRDASGALIELTLSPNGTLSRLRLLQLNSPASSLGGQPGSQGAVTPGVDGAIRALTSDVAGWVVGQVFDSTGARVQRVVDISGKVVARAVDATGRVVRQESLGNVLQLIPMSESRRSDGRIVRVVRDSVGGLLEVILGSQGQLELVRALADQASGPRQ